MTSLFVGTDGLFLHSKSREFNFKCLALVWTPVFHSEPLTNVSVGAQLFLNLVLSKVAF